MKHVKRHILVVDEEGVMRDGLCALLSSETGIEVIGAASSDSAAVTAAESLRPDLVIMDLSPSMGGRAETIRVLRRRLPEVKVLVLTFHKEDEFINAALRAGADGYVLKSDSRMELLTAIRIIAAGKGYISPTICDRVVDGYVRTQDSAPKQEAAPGALTERERQIIRLIAEGYRTREMAQQLSLSHKTVEKHRTNVMRKLGLRSATAVAAYAIANGFLNR